MFHKKASHLGIAISFVIFITSLLFIYSIAYNAKIKPPSYKKSMIEYIETKIKDETSSIVDIYTISIDRKDEEIESQNCIALRGLLNYIEPEQNNKNLIVINKTNKKIESYFNGNSLIIKKPGNFSKITVCEDFPLINEMSDIGSCLQLDYNTNYYMGFTAQEKYISEKKIIEIINYYNIGESNYQDLKIRFKIPTNYEFGIGFIDDEGTEYLTTSKELKTEKYVEKKPIMYISQDGKILGGYLKISVW